MNVIVENMIRFIRGKGEEADLKQACLYLDNIELGFVM